MAEPLKSALSHRLVCQLRPKIGSRDASPWAPDSPMASEKDRILALRSQLHQVFVSDRLLAVCEVVVSQLQPKDENALPNTTELERELEVSPNAAPADTVHLRLSRLRTRTGIDTDYMLTIAICVGCEGTTQSGQQFDYSREITVSCSFIVSVSSSGSESILAAFISSHETECAEEDASRLVGPNIGPNTTRLPSSVSSPDLGHQPKQCCSPTSTSCKQIHQSKEFQPGFHAGQRGRTGKIRRGCCDG